MMNHCNTYNVSLDVEQLNHISGGDLEFERELLELYVEDAAEHLSTLQGAIADYRFSVIEEMAHHIKGASANVGIIDMRRYAAELEVVARQQQKENLAHLIDQMEQTLSQLQQALNHDFQQQAV